MKKSVVILLALVLSVPVFAQGKFGADSAECVKYLSYFSEYMKQNNLKEAAGPWREALSICPPTANQYLFINGQKILRFEIPQERSNPERVKELVDSLLMLSDVRAQYYPKYYAASLNNKAIDAINYLKGDPERCYQIVSEVTSTLEGKCSASVYINQMQLIIGLNKAGKATPEQVLEDYNRLMGYMEQSTNNDVINAKANVEQLFIDSGVASCDNLIALYTPRFENAKDNKAALTNMVKMLSKSDCFDNDLFLKVVEALYAIEPSKESAYYLYKLYSSRGENESAAQYLTEAIGHLDGADKPEDIALLADYNLELATFYFKNLGRSAAAVSVAKTVPDLNPALAGKAYLLIGTIWGSQKCSGNEVESRAQFWVALDYMTRARNADPSLEEETSRLSAQYRRYLPQQADAFMYDLVDGASYVVSCNGMREVTTVRTNK